MSEVTCNGPMDEAIYHADPAPKPSLSASIAKLLIEESPRHAWTAHPKLNPQAVEEEKEMFDLGTATHALLLEGMDLMEELDFPDWRTKASKEARDEARAAGKLPILSKYVEPIRRMVDIAHEFLATCELKTSIGDFLPEHTVVWEHEGIYRKARMDLLHKTEPLVVDYKTVPNANPADFARRIVQMGYEYQTAQYADAVREIRRLDRDIRFLFLVQEREEPYSCSLVGADPSLLALGHFKMTAACKLWKSCLDRNQWPAYPGQIYWAEAPAWALLEWENRHGI